MYKGNSASLQRAHKIHEIAPSSLVEEDFIPSAANMSISQCKAERAQLMIEKVRAEQDLALAKRQRHSSEVGFLGKRYMALCGRLGIINDRIKDLNRDNNADALKLAVRELCDPELLRRIQDRQREIYEAAL